MVVVENRFWKNVMSGLQEMTNFKKKYRNFCNTSLFSIENPVKEGANVNF